MADEALKEAMGGASTPIIEAPIVETSKIEDTSTEVNFDDFLTIKDSPLMSKEKTPEPKKEEVKLDETKVEDKKEAKIEDKKDEKKVEGTLSPAKKPVLTRDYSGLPEAIMPLFKTMSNDTFNALKPFYIEATTTKTKYDELLAKPPVIADKNALPPNYYEHPNAYTLSPEYAAAEKDAVESQQVLEHWRNQLDEVRNGATEFTTLSRNKEEQIVYGAKQKVDQRTQSYLESLFFSSNNQASKFAQNLGSVKTGFESKHKAAINELQTYEKDFFKMYEDPKHPAIAVIKDTLSKLNPVFQSNPLASFSVKAAVTINALTQALIAERAKNDGKKEVTAKDKTKTAQELAGPTDSGVIEDVTKKKDEVTFDEFEKVIKGDQ